MSQVIGQVWREVVGCRNWPVMRVPEKCKMASILSRPQCVKLYFICKGPRTSLLVYIYVPLKNIVLQQQIVKSAISNMVIYIFMSLLYIPIELVNTVAVCTKMTP